MAVSLSKGGNVSLTKEAPGLTAVTVGLGWDVRTTTGTDFDLDASAIAVNTQGKVYSDAHFVFFNNKQTPDSTIVHTGDNRTGEGAGDDEAINVNLAGLPGLSLPCGLSEGLPVGLQVIGKALGEEMVLRVAYAYEQAHGGPLARPELATAP